MDIQTKLCTKCKIVKPISSFYKKTRNKKNPHGFSSDCKDCQKAYYNEYRKTEKGKLYFEIYRKSHNCKAQRKKSEQKHKNRLLWRRAKHRAIKNGIEFNIDYDDIIVPEICPILGIPLSKNSNGPRGNWPSIDRVDNSKGYIKGNVRVISLKANMLKRDGTIDDFKKIINYMEQHFNNLNL